MENKTISLNINSAVTLKRDRFNETIKRNKAGMTSTVVVRVMKAKPIENAEHRRSETFFLTQ